MIELDVCYENWVKNVSVSIRLYENIPNSTYSDDNYFKMILACVCNFKY